MRVAVALPHCVGCLLSEFLKPLLHTHSGISLQKVQMLMDFELDLYSITVACLQLKSKIILQEVFKSSRPANDVHKINEIE